ncbi:hypothetical protein DMB66_11435 [Actinoplanes sp. ATCC 53533]|nr:hypothetical protein DMB66_11435 [Actinoplanes sp. ATCC 53533]
MTSLVLGTSFVVLVIVLVARRSRRRFQESDVAFRCRLRLLGHRSALWPSLRRHWSRPMWAMWDEDVLIVRRGPVLARTLPLRTQPLVDGVHNLLFEAPRLCGTRPIGVVLRVWDGAWIEVAAATDDRMKVVGPFLAAAISDLPQAPAPRRRI